jgi:putative peptide maturation dehydrogenase
MTRVRRTRYLYLQLASGELLDVAALAHGRVELASAERVIASSALSGGQRTLSSDELSLLLEIPDDTWTDVPPAHAETAGRLAADGLLVAETANGPLAELRRRDERLAEDGWHPSAALVHFVGKWRDVALAVDRELWGETPAALAARYDTFVERRGPPPPSFHVLGGERKELPLVTRDGGLYDTLARRQTTRVFDPDAPVGVEQLGLLLHQVFGCHGYAPITDDVVVLRKTSPSGGGRHSLEAYPLLLNVDGFDCGLYHYDVGDHSLELVRRLPRDQAQALATTFVAGQSWIRDAAAVVVIASRFPRMLWKYRRNNRAYLTLFMEAGHFSQTFYLVCADLGLGAFVSAAVNGGNVEDALGLDPVLEGVLAVCGCGVPLPGPHPLQPEVLPYHPRETRLYPRV